MAKRALHQPCSRGQPGTEIPTKPTDLSTGADTWLGGGGTPNILHRGKKIPTGITFHQTQPQLTARHLGKKVRPSGQLKHSESPPTQLHTVLITTQERTCRSRTSQTCVPHVERVSCRVSAVRTGLLPNTSPKPFANHTCVNNIAV